MWKTGVVKFAIRQSGYLCDDYLFLAERMIQSYYLHVWTNPAQFVSNGVQNNHVNYLASRSEWQQLLPEAAMRTHCFSQPNTLSKFNQSCLNDDYIWKEVSKSLWWATHMNLAGISKAQREERHSSSLVYSTTRVSLTFSVRDLLRKHPPWSSKLSIILDTLHKSQILGDYAYLSVAAVHTEKPPTFSTVLSHQPFEPPVSVTPLPFPSQCLLIMQVVHRWYTGLRQGRNTGDQCAIYSF